MSQKNAKQRGENEKERKRREDYERFGIYEPPSMRFWPCFKITALFILVGIVLWTIYSNVLWATISDRMQYYRWCIDANENRVLPRRNVSSLIEPPPLAYGVFAIDYRQREVRWKLHDVLGTSVTLGDITIRGPLKHDSPYTAPVVIGLGTSKDSTGHRYEGVLDIAGKLAADIIERPYAYYISLENDTGYEIARDALTDMCTNNL